MTWIQIVQLSVYGLMAVWVVIDIVIELRHVKTVKKLDKMIKETEERIRGEWLVSTLAETEDGAHFTELRTGCADGEVTELWTEEGKVGEMVSGTDTESDELDGK